MAFRKVERLYKSLRLNNEPRRTRLNGDVRHLCTEECCILTSEIGGVLRNLQRATRASRRDKTQKFHLKVRFRAGSLSNVGKAVSLQLQIHAPTKRDMCFLLRLSSQLNSKTGKVMSCRADQTYSGTCDPCGIR